MSDEQKPKLNQVHVPEAYRTPFSELWPTLKKAAVATLLVNASFWGSFEGSRYAIAHSEKIRTNPVYAYLHGWFLENIFDGYERN
jgi:hypothetical protein